VAEEVLQPSGVHALASQGVASAVA
jgi:hypothetical protein